jgi:S-adenosylmethionine:tRNA ribosyltransferase-isomerase
MNTAELDYDLPPELIAQHPCPHRDGSRLLVLDREKQTLQTDIYRNVARYLRAGDCMVLNDTRVIRARLFAHKATGARIELFLLHEELPGCWTALVRPSSRVRPGTTVTFGAGLCAVVGEVLPEGRRRIHFERSDVLALLEASGEVPLPPYIRRDTPEAEDPRHYQTIYAEKPGAIAAPTAGLHFTPEVFASLDAAGVERTFLTLHVGYGTFKPITAGTLEEHRVEAEEFIFPEECAAHLNGVRVSGGRVVAVGTTVTRVLETQYREGAYRPGAGITDTYIYPPYRFQAVDILQTNFHLPRSSLLALVCAFAGTEFTIEAYRYAVRERFRFYSYGDVMLIL